VKIKITKIIIYLIIDIIKIKP